MARPRDRAHARARPTRSWPRTWPRSTSRRRTRPPSKTCDASGLRRGAASLGRSYAVSKRYALLRMRARRAAARRVQHGQDRQHRDRARGAGRDRRPRVPGVPPRSRTARAGRAALPRAKHAPRPGRPFPGALHLWESEYLLRHPPTPARAVDGDHDRARADRAGGVGVLPRRAAAAGVLDGRPRRRARSPTRSSPSGWIRAPLRWFDREFAPALGIDVFEQPFDPGVGPRRDRDARRCACCCSARRTSTRRPRALGRFLGPAGAGAGARPATRRATKELRRGATGSSSAAARLPRAGARRGLRLPLRPALLCR